MSWGTRGKNAHHFRRNALSWNMRVSKIHGVDAPEVGSADLSQLLLDEEIINVFFFPKAERMVCHAVLAGWKHVQFCPSALLQMRRNSVD